MQKLFSLLPEKRGIKFLLKLLDKLYFFTLGVIKINTGYRDGIHPKPNVTNFHNFFFSNVDSEDVVLDLDVPTETLLKK